MVATNTPSGEPRAHPLIRYGSLEYPHLGINLSRHRGPGEIKFLCLPMDDGGRTAVLEAIAGATRADAEKILRAIEQIAR